MSEHFSVEAFTAASPSNRSCVIYLKARQRTQRQQGRYSEYLATTMTLTLTCWEQWVCCSYQKLHEKYGGTLWIFFFSLSGIPGNYRSQFCEKKKKNPHFPAWAVSSRLLNLISNVPSVTNLEMPARLGAPLSPSCTAVACLTFVSTDFRWAFPLLAAKQMWLHRWKRQTSYSWYSAAGPVNILPSMMPSPAEISALWMAPQWAEAQPTGPRKLGNVLDLALEKIRGNVCIGSLWGEEPLTGVCSEYQACPESMGSCTKKKEEKMLKLGHWMDGF